MTGTSQVRENNQVTIPAEILEKAGIGIGTILKFELRTDGILLKPENISPVDSKEVKAEEEELEYLEDMVLAKLIQEVEGEESFTPEGGRAVYEAYLRGENS